VAAAMQAVTTVGPCRAQPAGEACLGILASTGAGAGSGPFKAHDRNHLARTTWRSLPDVRSAHACRRHKAWVKASSLAFSPAARGSIVRVPACPALTQTGLERSTCPRAA
jgi:hypothetical protein